MVRNFSTNSDGGHAIQTDIGEKEKNKRRDEQ